MQGRVVKLGQTQTNIARQQTNHMEQTPTTLLAWVFVQYFFSSFLTFLCSLSKIFSCPYVVSVSLSKDKKYLLQDFLLVYKFFTYYSLKHIFNTQITLYNHFSNLKLLVLNIKWCYKGFKYLALYHEFNAFHNHLTTFTYFFCILLKGWNTPNWVG